MKLRKPKNIGKRQKKMSFFSYNFSPKNRKGTILMENLIFIILNLVFLSILILFLFSKMGGAAVLEERYAKQIALLLDSAKPGMTISLDMEDAIQKAEKEEWPADKVVTIEENVVTVKLREKGGYSYSYFNDMKTSPNFNLTNKKEYYFVIEEK